MVSRKTPRTIVHLVHRLTVGGAERVLVNLINGSSRQLRHVICSFFPADDFAEQIIPEKRVLVNLNKKSGNDYTIPKKISAVCREYRADVIHCQGWGTYFEGLVAAKVLRRKTRFIFAFRGKTVGDLSGIPRRRIWTQKMGALFCDAIVTPSEEMRSDYARMIGIDTEKISVISNGVNTDLFCPVSDRSEAKRRLGIPVDAGVVGCAARFDPVKDLPALVRSFAFCQKNVSNAHLLLVGDGDQMDAIRQEIHQNDLKDFVTLTGQRSDVARCLQAMDIYVQPSLYEGLSNTILEAMSTGLPVIARDVGGTKEVVRNEYSGILLPWDTKDGFTEAINRLLQDKKMCLDMGRAGRKMIEKHYSIQQMVSSYDKLFSQV